MLEGGFMKLKNYELLDINGGAISATWLNSCSRFVSLVIGVGRMVGSSLRRIINRNFC